jgi:uridine phosphorylase
VRSKFYDQPSVFRAENLLREARRQKNLAEGNVPAVCLLDPDGDVVRMLVARQQAIRDPHWACYHTDLYTFTWEGQVYGVIGCAVGASFATLLAEQLFASGCQLLISVTSSGQIVPMGDPPYFVLITRALRDEGTSYHYLPPGDYASLAPNLLALGQDAFAACAEPVVFGATWSTDAPYRETADAIEQARLAGILAVEMEAAALYAFGESQQRPVICFAHVTNQMAQIDGDFEKGEANGALTTLRLVAITARAWLASQAQRAD